MNKEERKAMQQAFKDMRACDININIIVVVIKK
jgi:hypothetical protein